MLNDSYSSFSAFCDRYLGPSLGIHLIRDGSVSLRQLINVGYHIFNNDTALGLETLSSGGILITPIYPLC